MHAKTKEALDKLRSDILNNKYRYEMPFPSEYNLMHRFGIGRGAARAILAQLRSEQLISQTTRGKSSCTLYHYTPPKLNVKLLFLCINETLFFGDVIFEEQYYGIMQRCAELGYQLDTLYASDEDEVNATIVDYVRKNSYAGVVTTIFPFEKCIATLVDAGIPCVIAAYEEGCTLPCSQINFRDVGRQAGYLLWKQHRKNFVVLSGDQHTWLYREMMAGFRGALAEEKYYIPDENIMIVNKEAPLTQKLHQSVDAFLNDRNPDAIFVMRDYRAYFVYGFALKYNIKIPDNLSVVSFDNHSWSASKIVGLTTIEEPCLQLGIEAINFIHEWITTNTRPQNRLLYGKTILRKSIVQETEAQMQP